MADIRKKTRRAQSPILVAAPAAPAAKSQAKPAQASKAAASSAPALPGIDLATLQSSQDPTIRALAALLAQQSAAPPAALEEPQGPTVAVELYETKAGTTYPAVMIWGQGSPLYKKDGSRRACDIFLRASADDRNQWDLLMQVVDSAREAIEAQVSDIQADLKASK